MWAGYAHVSTLKHVLNIRPDKHQIDAERPTDTHVDHVVSMEFMTSLATGIVSRAKLASPKRKTRAGRSCRSRDTISVHVSDHEEAHGGWRHTG